MFAYKNKNETPIIPTPETVLGFTVLEFIDYENTQDPSVGTYDNGVIERQLTNTVFTYNQQFKQYQDSTGMFILYQNSDMHTWQFNFVNDMNAWLRTIDAVDNPFAEGVIWRDIQGATTKLKFTNYIE